MLISIISIRTLLSVILPIAVCSLLTSCQNNVQAQKKVNSESSVYQTGDIIFQASESRQCQAVKMATHSEVSHCGIVFSEHGKWLVLEAIEPVQITPLQEFIERGIGSHYTIKRMHGMYPISKMAIEKMVSKGKQWIGKHYDIYFNWSENELYCSELVWKLYKQQLNIELCKLKPLKSYDLKDNLVGEMMIERYGNNIPYDENMVAPSDIFASNKLVLVEQK